MKKWGVLFVLMGLFLLPCQTWAVDGSVLANWWTRDDYCAEMAASIPEHKDNDGSFSVMGDLVYMKEFSTMTVDISAKSSIGVCLHNIFSDKEDVNDIKKLVETVNEYYYSVILSGRLNVLPREYFTNDGIYKESNARNLYELFMNPDCGIGMTSGRFLCQIDQLSIVDDYAKVIIYREANISGYNPYNNTHGWRLENDVREGYLLRKNSGVWQIENIIFDNKEYYIGDDDKLISDRGGFNTFEFFKESRDLSVLKQAFSFEKCQPNSYLPFGNYSDFIIGDLTSPVFDYEKMLEVKNGYGTLISNWNEMQTYKMRNNDE